jgi:hypothetical protein
MMKWQMASSWIAGVEYDEDNDDEDYSESEKENEADNDETEGYDKMDPNELADILNDKISGKMK